MCLSMCVCVSVSVYVSVCMSDMGDKYCNVFNILHWSKLIVQLTGHAINGGVNNRGVSNGGINNRGVGNGGVSNGGVNT